MIGEQFSADRWWWDRIGAAFDWAPLVPDDPQNVAWIAAGRPVHRATRRPVVPPISGEIERRTRR